MTMNGRRLLPNIDENYFGNCTFYLCLSFSMDDLNNLTVDQLFQQTNIDKHHHTSTVHLGW